MIHRRPVDRLSKPGQYTRRLREHYVCSNCRRGPERHYRCAPCRAVQRMYSQRTYRKSTKARLERYRTAKRAVGLCIEYPCETPTTRFVRCLEHRRLISESTKRWIRKVRAA